MYLVRRARGPPKKGKGSDMTNMNTTATTNAAVETAKVTRKDALAAAMTKFDANDPIYAVLAKMLEQVSKTRTGETPSQAKAKAERHDLMMACMGAIHANPDVAINSTWLAANVPGVRSTQKATTLMGLAIKEGLVEKVYNAKKVYYKAI